MTRSDTIAHSIGKSLREFPEAEVSIRPIHPALSDFFDIFFSIKGKLYGILIQKANEERDYSLLQKRLILSKLALGNLAVRTIGILRKQKPDTRSDLDFDITIPESKPKEIEYITKNDDFVPRKIPSTILDKHFYIYGRLQNFNQHIIKNFISRETEASKVREGSKFTSDGEYGYEVIMGKHHTERLRSLVYHNLSNIYAIDNGIPYPRYTAVKLVKFRNKFHEPTNYYGRISKILAFSGLLIVPERYNISDFFKRIKPLYYGNKPTSD